MRRPAALAVETKQPVNQEFELSSSRRFSQSTRTSSCTTSSIRSKRSDSRESLPNPPPPPPSVDSPGPTPSIRLLFSLLPTRTFFLLIFPAVFTSIIAGGVAPFMTYVIGQSFDAFAAFPITPDPSEAAKSALLRGVGFAALQLVALAVGALALSSITSCLWIWTGEHNAKAVRKLVYTAVTEKEMVWFDLKMGSEGDVQAADAQGPLGAGGLMAKFARETDDVRAASSIAAGMMLQSLTTILTCLILAFLRSPSLAAVILSAVPMLMFIQILSQTFAAPLFAGERQQTAVAATLVDRSVAAIATVKAFNAQAFELAAVSTVLSRANSKARKLATIWAGHNGASQFVMMAMFVQSFWYGAKLVRDGKVSPGDVMSVFWACLIATTNFQIFMPQIIVITKGKLAMAALLALCQAPLQPPSAESPTRKRALSRKLTVSNLRKIRPARCTGEISIHSITFAYPTRPTLPILRDVSLYLPANETTFIVGGSGSGKSTIAALLLRMYTPSSGRIDIDDQDTMYLDDGWMKENMAGVSQGCTLFDGTVHENVAMGLERNVTREEVIDACRAALMHDFVRDLPEEYETRLGNGGAALSGGQRQRLAIARARLRNPPILILDEATSALDSTSRILVFEALKRWRQGKTTIVITHDLSQITPKDFLYVLHKGEVVEQGFRADLENTCGVFSEMVESQGQTGGFLPEKVIDGEDAAEVEEILGKVEEEQTVEEQAPPKHATLRPLTLGNWVFEAIAQLTGQSAPSTDGPTATRMLSPDLFSKEVDSARMRRPSSAHLTLPFPPQARTKQRKRLSLQFEPTTPTTPTASLYRHQLSPRASQDSLVQDDGSFEGEKTNLTRSGAKAVELRGGRRERTRWDNAKLTQVSVATTKRKSQYQEATNGQSPPQSDVPRQSVWRLVRDIYPTLPHKPILLLGLVACVISGAMNPIFAFLLSRLLFEVSVGATNTASINKYGAIVLGIAAADGLFMFLKYLIMETNAISWVNTLRTKTLKLVLAQDKKWFDQPAHSAPALVQILIKDGDDARTLISVVVGQCLVVVTMLGVGLVWALVRGWQLTLVGFAIAPVFAGTMALQTALVAKSESRNKRARENVAKIYYEAIANIRGIRSIGLEHVFRKQFDAAIEVALRTGIRGALFEGCTYGFSSAFIYFAEAVLFYVGAVLIAKGTYTYLQMVEVLNLVVFSVSIGSQLMAFTQRIAKSLQATSDFNKLLQLSTDTDESKGIFRPPVSGSVTFKEVSFSYSERADVRVLKNVNLDLADGECVAIVGGSGSGKSTIAGLLQRLYEPTSGSISIGSEELRTLDTTYLREYVSVVSQNPNLFDATITENIAYGNKNLTEEDVRNAAKAANVHDFIMGLPNGYNTMVGENASLISGGQAQRLQIARALARPSKILILDECTSALDPANQAAVMETIRNAKLGRTTIMVTHKLQVMRMCDRILVVHDGEIGESGTYDQLMAKNGIFFGLARGGEWNGE